MILEINHVNGLVEWIDIAAARTTGSRGATFFLTDSGQVYSILFMPQATRNAWAYVAENVTRDGHVLRGNLVLGGSSGKYRPPFVLFTGSPFCMAPRLHDLAPPLI